MHKIWKFKRNILFFLSILDFAEKINVTAIKYTDHIREILEGRM